jgi:hypothetical protein
MVWEAAGYLGGLGIRKAAAGTANKARIRQAMSPSGALIPQPLLDIDRVITDGYFFQLGVPWGWRDLNPGEVSYITAQNGVPTVAGVVAERSDGDWTSVLVSAVDMKGGNLSEIIIGADWLHKERFSKGQNGRPLGSPAKILIGGELGLILHYGHDVAGAVRGQPSLPVVSVSTTECYFSRLGQGFRVEFLTGSVYHERYFPCLWTMFGSWRWIR